METNTSLAERIVRVETNQKLIAERAAEDRADVKRVVDDLHEEISDLRKEVVETRERVTDVAGSVQTAVDQITGGRKTLHALWIAGGVTATVVAWGSGLLKWLAGLPK